VHITLSNSDWSERREREGERERGRERESRVKEIESREKEREKEGERKNDVEYGCFILIFKMNDGCLGTF